MVLLVFWLTLPAWGLFRLFARKPPADGQKRTSTQGTRVQLALYTLIVVGFGVGFTFWARHLGLSWRVVLGALLVIEALPAVVVALTEWWRLSMLGHSVGLMICGFGLPLVDQSSVVVLVGTAVFLGNLLSAGILYGQVRYYEASAASSRTLETCGQNSAVGPVSNLPRA